MIGKIAVDDHRNAWQTAQESPWVMLFLAITTLIFWIVATMVRINDSESLFLVLGGLHTFDPNKATLMPSFNLVSQVIDLMTGKYSATYLMAECMGLFVEFFTNALTLGYSYPQHIVHKNSTYGITPSVSRAAFHREYAFLGGGLVLIVVNFATDCWYGPGNGLAHFLYALPVNLMASFGLSLFILLSRTTYILLKEMVAKRRKTA